MSSESTLTKDARRVPIYVYPTEGTAIVFFLFWIFWIKVFCSFGARSTRLYLHNMTCLVPTQRFCHALHAPGAGGEQGISPASSVLYSLPPVQVQARGQMVLDDTHTHNKPGFAPLPFWAWLLSDWSSRHIDDGQSQLLGWVRLPPTLQVVR